MPIKFVNAKKLHRRQYAFLFVCCLPLLSVTAFCLGHSLHFTKTNFRQLSSFCKHSSRSHCYKQLPEDTVISLCNLLQRHSQHHHGGSSPFPIWFTFWSMQYFHLFKHYPFSPFLQLDKHLLPFIAAFLPHLRFPYCSFSHSFPPFLCQAKFFVGLGNSQFPSSATCREPGSNWFPSLRQSSQHTSCPANILSLANYTSFHPGWEKCAALSAC